MFYISLSIPISVRLLSSHLSQCGHYLSLSSQDICNKNVVNYCTSLSDRLVIEPHLLLVMFFFVDSPPPFPFCVN